MSDKSTIYDIAKALSLSTSTISRALNNDRRISISTRAIVKRTAVELNYRRNHVAASLRKGKTKVLGVIVPRIGSSFFADAIQGIEQVANKAGYFVTICQSHESFENEVKSVNALIEARVDGILLSCSKETRSFEHLRKVIDANIPLIIFDRVVDDLDINSVSIDDFSGAYEATKHLIQQGYSRIAHFTLAEPVPIYQNRLAGYRQALIDFQLDADPELIILSKELQFDDGEFAMQQLMALPKPPDAVFSASARSAAGISRYLKKCNIQVPHQIGVIGFCDEPFASLFDPPLSTVDQHSCALGNAAAELFLRMLKESSLGNSQKIVIKPTLIIRESSVR